MEKKTPQRRNSIKITGDLFTTLVKTDLGYTCEKEFRFHPVRQWRMDYAIPEHKVFIEVEGGVWSGGRHIRAKGFLSDCEKYNTAAMMGWRLLRVTPDTLYSRQTLMMIKHTIEGTYDPQTERKTRTEASQIKRLKLKTK